MNPVLCLIYIVCIPIMVFIINKIFLAPTPLTEKNVGNVFCVLHSEPYKNGYIAELIDPREMRKGEKNYGRDYFISNEIGESIENFEIYVLKKSQTTSQFYFEVNTAEIEN